MRINCIWCGHKVELDDVYDNYDGYVKCFTCGGLLKIKTEEGGLKSVALIRVSENQTSKETCDSVILR